jgi:thiamine biosynthesis lipoprotein
MLIAAATTGCERSAAELSLGGQTMGTTWSIKAVDCQENQCADLQPIIERRLEALNHSLSHFEPDSEIALFNQSSDSGWMPVSQDTATVVAYALSVSKLSGGAFDITLARAINAWGFGNVEAGEIPEAAALLEVRSHTGYEKLELRQSPRALRKLDPRVQINLSAIAKGYAVDQLVYVLEARGLDRFMVEIGGEIRTAGNRADGQPWRIGIQPPTEYMQIEYIVTPGDAAVATSGDYRNFYMLDGRRISHTIDPATAQPILNQIASASVIAPDAMQADALATALMVMGPDEASRFAQQHDIAMLLLVRNGQDVKPIASAAFTPYLLSN